MLRPSGVLGFERQGDLLFAAAPSSAHARVEFSSRASDGFKVTDLRSGASVKALQQGLRPAAREAAKGFVVYRGADATGSDVIHRPTPLGTEDYTLFRAPPERSEIVYRVELGDGVAGLRLVAGSIEFVDPTGTPRIQIARPFLRDARGTSRSAALSVRGCKVDSNPAAPWGRSPVAPGARECVVAVNWDPAELSYPVLLDPSWTSTADLAVPVWGHTATTLPDGRVLYAGGIVNDLQTRAAQLYDPATRTWARTGDMNDARLNHTANVVWPAGSDRLLVIGGTDQTQTFLRTAELYDPRSGSWTRTAGPMAVGRVFQTSLALAPTVVLVAGGYDSDTTATAECELYDANQDTWTPTASLSTARAQHIAALTAEEGVSPPRVPPLALVAGGSTAQAIVASTEVYFATITGDSWSGEWFPTGDLGTARGAHAGASLPDGSVIVAGGSDPAFNDIASAERYVRHLGAWQPAGNLGSARNSLKATTLSTGAVVVAGGAFLSGDTFKTSTGVDLFNPATGAWVTLSSMNVDRVTFSLTTMLDDLVLAGGGQTDEAAGPTATSETIELLRSGTPCESNAQCSTGACTNGACLGWSREPMPKSGVPFTTPTQNAVPCDGRMPAPGSVTSSYLLEEHTDIVDYVSCFKPRPNTEVWTITQPNVHKPATDYPFIRFQQGDVIQLAAGGCAQTGGSGLTWKRYVNPDPPDQSDRYYGSVEIPGLLPPTRVSDALKGAPLTVTNDLGAHNFLRLLYEDNDYSDNGYWNPDDGTTQQCDDLIKAWVVVIAQHGCANQSSLNCRTGLPMDLLVTRRDENNVAVDPAWAWETIVGSPTPSTQACGLSLKTEAMPEDNVSLCTHQPTEEHSDYLKCPTNDPAKDWGGTPGRIGGHINWGAAKYSGTLTGWSGISTDDGDYQFNFTPDSRTGFTGTNAEIELEFDSDETVDRAQSSWWQAFRAAAEGDTIARYTDNTPAIIIGELGIDCAHISCSSELHPVYLMAIHQMNASFPVSLDDDRWAVFARNSGDNGYCGGPNNSNLSTPGNALSIDLPVPSTEGCWTPTLLDTSEYKFSDPGMAVSFAARQNVAHLVFTLLAPDAHSFIDGSFDVKWTPTACSGPVQKQPAQE